MSVLWYEEFFSDAFIFKPLKDICKGLGFRILGQKPEVKESGHENDRGGNKEEDSD